VNQSRLLGPALAQHSSLLSELTAMSTNQISTNGDALKAQTVSSGGITTEPSVGFLEDGEESRNKAAVKIQRHYRDHRERRHLKGLNLTPDQRWTEVLKARIKNTAFFEQC
jgi:hypothetical protein